MGAIKQNWRILTTGRVAQGSELRRLVYIIIIVIIIIITRPKPAYGRQGLVGVSLCASGAQLGLGGPNLPS